MFSIMVQNQIWHQITKCHSESSQPC